MSLKPELKRIVGLDEAGRGPLAGPVVAGAVILNPEAVISGLQDSKLLSEKKREQLFLLIQEKALAWSVGQASVEEVDKLNILQASLLAMQRAVAALKLLPDLALVDGNRCPLLPCETQAIVGGDKLVPAISAASIVAKVLRDREMKRLHQEFPLYGFDKHKGYGTAEHMQALNNHGPCLIHRRSFAPVALLIK